MSMTTPLVYLGIDIAKDTLAVAGPGLRLPVPNTAEGHTQLLAAARALRTPVHFICEATGGYQPPPAATPLAQDSPVAPLPPPPAPQPAPFSRPLGHTRPLHPPTPSDSRAALAPPAEPNAPP